MSKRPTSYDLVSISHLVSSDTYSSRYVQVFGLLIGRKENPSLIKSDPLILAPLPSSVKSSQAQPLSAANSSEKILIYIDSISLSIITSLVKLGLNVPIHVGGSVRPTNERIFRDEVEIDAYFLRPAEELADATNATEFEQVLEAREDFFKDLIGKRNPF